MKHLSAFFHTYTSLFLLFILATHGLRAEIVPVSLEARIAESHIIALVSLEKKASYWDASHQNIYTLNILKVKAYMKGYNGQEYIGLIEMGGEVGLEGQKVFPHVDLDTHHEYVVFLEGENREIDNKVLRERRPYLHQGRAYASVQGVLTLQDGRYVDRLVESPMTEEQLFARVEEMVGEHAFTPEGFLYLPRPFMPPLPQRSANIANLSNRGGTTGFVAGTIDSSHILVIDGDNFDPFGVPGTIEFSNAADGGATYIRTPESSDVISWSNSRIEVKIPDQAGNGNVRVTTALGISTFTAPITIDWSVVPVYSTQVGFFDTTRQRLEYVATNGNAPPGGGYSIQFSPAFLSDTLAMAAFFRAMHTWRCATLVNISPSYVPVTAPFAQNGVSQVEFAPPATLGVGVLFQSILRYTLSSTTSCTRFNTLWRMTEIDIRFTTDVTPVGYTPPPAYSWNMGPAASGGAGSPTFDFESAALTALGRSLGLGYINDSNSVMFHMLPQGTDRRILGGPEASAGSYKVNHSIQPKCVTSPANMLALTSSSCVLGAGVDDFTGEHLPSQGIKLSWSSSSESSLAEYVLEKQSPDGSFNPLTSVQPKGVTSTPASYFHLDPAAVPGSNFYRLQLTDLNGTTLYSSVIEVRVESEAAFTLFPNPAREYFQLVFQEDGAAQARFSLFAPDGRSVWTSSWLHQDQSQQQVSLSNLSPGVYFYSFQAGNYRKHGKLVIAQ